MITNLIPQKPIRHIGLRRKHQQTKGSCAEVEGERCDHQFSCKCKKPKSTRWCAHLPIIYRKPIFRKAARSPTNHTPRKRSPTRSQRKRSQRKPKGGEAQVARTLILLLAQQESKTRGRGGKGTHHNSFRNAFIHTYPFFEMHTFTLISFLFAKYT